MSSTKYTAAPIPIRLWLNLTMNLQPKYQGESPFQLINLNSLYDFQISEYTKRTEQLREEQSSSSVPI